MSFWMLPVEVTVQPAASNRCLAVPARPLVDVLLRTTSGMGWAAADVEPLLCGEVGACVDGWAVWVRVEVAVAVTVEVPRATALACRPFGWRSATRATTATTMPSTESRMPPMRSACRRCGVAGGRLDILSGRITRRA